MTESQEDKEYVYPVECLRILEQGIAMITLEIEFLNVRVCERAGRVPSQEAS